MKCNKLVKNVPLVGLRFRKLLLVHGDDQCNPCFHICNFLSLSSSAK
jgi:hypothetical protein